MASKDIIAALVAETASILGVGEIPADEDRDAWLLATTDETLIDLEFDAGSDRIVLSCAVGDIDPAARPAVYEMLLQFNYMWDVTAGARMALDGFPGQAVLMFDLAADGVTPARLISAVTQMTTTQQAWRDVFAAAAAAAAAEIH